MNNILEKLSLSSLNKKQIDELKLTGKIYTDMNNIGNKGKNKVIISDIFDLIIEHFYMGDLKLKFGENLGFDDEAIYVNHLNEDYSDVVVGLLKDVIKSYFNRLDDVYDKIDQDMFKLVKLAILNNEDIVLDKLANLTTIELLNKSGINCSIDKTKVYKKEVNKLISDNASRNKRLLEHCVNYKLSNDLSTTQIRKVFTCFSSDVFNKANSRQKAQLMNLVYNYFSFTNENRIARYKKIITNNFNNIDALNFVVNELAYKDNSNTLNNIRNKKLLEDFKTGFKYIIKNETNKDNIKLLKEVSIKNIHKK